MQSQFGEMLHAYTYQFAMHLTMTECIIVQYI